LAGSVAITYEEQDEVHRHLIEIVCINIGRTFKLKRIIYSFTP